MKIIKDFIVREIAGECVLVPTGKTALEFSGMVSLSPSGQFIWENLEKAESLNQLIDMILNEFDVDEKTARQETIEFIASLLTRGFITTTREDKTW
ncbi:MAG: PqqD family protein [Lachnospiraceae bacterium]|nr:PqqD family protein [Lachnospiraceae bacterium]